jgi:glycosyltransferase involved in cell wall biosynthesis
MIEKKLRIAIITNIIPTYREGFYDRLFVRDDILTRVYCQNHMPGINIIPIHDKYSKHVKIINYLSAKREKIVWQFLPWKEIIRDFDVIFVGGNPHVVSDVIFGTYLRLRNKKIVLWTMAHSYRSNNVTEKIRLLWSKIFPYILVYTDKEVEYLRKKRFRKQKLLGMNNGLDQKKIDQNILLWNEPGLITWKKSNGLENRTIIISSARLEQKNNFELVLEAIPKIVKFFPDLLWCLIGGGEEEDHLKDKVKELSIENHVLFVGALYDEDKLAPYFLSAKIFVHPASIGLSLLHAFGYGLPVVTHNDNLHHGPEFAAFKDGITGFSFIKDDICNFSKIVIQLLSNEDLICKMKTTNQKIVREYYNIDVMVDRFVSIAKSAARFDL